jgi:membrane-bound lytic murein transglycosylase D
VSVEWSLVGHTHTAEFRQSATIGRDTSCDVRVSNEGVSRLHAKLYIKNGQWLVRDMGSGNGTFLDDVLIHKAVLPRKSTLRLGNDGPKLRIEAPGAPAGASVEDMAARYFGDASDDEAGHRTMMVRSAYRKVDQKQKRRYRSMIAGAAAMLVLSIGFGITQQLMLQKSRALAIDIFYNMKAMQVQVAQLEGLARTSADATHLPEINARHDEMRGLEAQYDGLLDELGVFEGELSDEDLIILRVARIFGECELNMPDGFAREVKNYINKWQSTNRLRLALGRMHENGLASVIASTLLENELPPQFLYVALQESGFDIRAVGPPTRFGIAKGIWQFMPATAWQYGLETGPLVELGRHDPLDDRFDADRATHAAARYLRDIYDKEAQASGLLVIAAYNWGPTNIRKRIRAMPDNPRDRNFWQLLSQHEIPKETYDYVFYILSAVVIGEDPALFGFDFENPLRTAEQQPPTSVVNL